MNKTIEIWRPVPGWHGQYEVSNQGRVRSLDREVTQQNNGGSLYTRTYAGRILKPAIVTGYPVVHLWDRQKAGKPKQQWLVHRLVAQVFIGQCPEGMECCHNDGNKLNASVDNLRYDTHSGNMLDRRKHGTTKVSSEQIAYIRSLPKTTDFADVALKIGICKPYVNMLRRGVNRVGVV